MLEASMAEDLQYPADNEQADGNKPHDRGAGMASDHGSDRKKRDYSNEKSEPNSCIKQDPGGYRREGQHDRRIEWNAEQAQPPQTERQNNGKKDDRDAKYMSYTIALIAMITGIGCQLPSEKVVHVACAER